MIKESILAIPMKKSLTLIFILSLFSCTPFDSNKLNKELIQGRWIQEQIFTENGDSIVIPEDYHSKNTLYFWGDSCHEVLEDIDTVSDRLFRFDINSYILSLDEKDYPINYLKIAKLTEDSLILQLNSRVYKYKKIE